MGRPARGLLPQLRGRRDELPVALRHDAAGRQPDEGAAARPRLHGRRPQGRRPAARLPRDARRQRDLLQPDLRRRLEPLATTPQDYKKIDPYFGDAEGLREPRQARRERSASGSSSTACSTTCRRTARCFDRYHHYPTVGACESTSLAVPRLVRLHRVGPATATCAGAAGPTSATTRAGSASTRSRSCRKTQAAVQAYFLTAPDSVAKRWLQRGASGWRMDVSGDPSFPDGYWETFRVGRQGGEPARADDPRDVAEGHDAAAHDPRRPARHDDELPAPRRGHRPARAAGLRLEGLRRQRPRSSASRSSPTGSRPVREDYPDAAYYSLMNLLDSHDTERLLWTLTPGAETTAATRGAERRPTWPTASAASGSPRCIQFTRARRADRLLRRRGRGDRRRRPRRPPHVPVGRPRRHARHGAARPLHGAGRRCATSSPRSPTATSGSSSATTRDETVAYGRKTGAAAAIVALNRSGSQPDAHDPGRRLPAGRHVARPALRRRNDGLGLAYRSPTGRCALTLPAMSALVLATGAVDLAPPGRADRPPRHGRGRERGLARLERRRRRRRLRRLPQPALGRRLRQGQRRPDHRHVVHDRPGSRTPAATTSSSGRSTPPATRAARRTRSSALPHLIDRLGEPPVAAVDDATRSRRPTGPTTSTARSGSTATRASPARRPACAPSSASGRTAPTRPATPPGRGSTPPSTPTPATTTSSSHRSSRRRPAPTTTPTATAPPTAATGSTPTSTGSATATRAAQAGSLTVDRERRHDGARGADRPPRRLGIARRDRARLGSRSPATRRCTATRFGEATRPAARTRRSPRHRAPTFTDTTVGEGETFFYVVRSVDTSFNRSGRSNEVAATAELRTVTLTFNVTVPATTDGTGRSVYIAGFLDRLDGGLPQWNPGGVVAHAGSTRRTGRSRSPARRRPSSSTSTRSATGTTSRRTGRPAARSRTAS